jgi:hypothetical protein
VFFYVCAVAFLALGTVLVFSARGWSFDFSRARIVSTGALFIKSTPLDAELFINGKEVSRGIGLLSSGTFLDKMRPDNYEIAVAKQGYTTWSKVLSVSSSKVTAATRAVLWPTTLVATTLAKQVDSFWLTGTGIILANSSGTLSVGNRLIRGQVVVAHDQASSKLVTKEDGVFFLTDLASPDSSLNLSILFQSLYERLPSATLSDTSRSNFPTIRKKSVRLEHVLLHPFSDTKLLLAANDGLYELDTRKIALERIAWVERFTAIAKGGSDAFIVNGSSTVTAVNLVLKTSVVYPFPIAGVLRTLIASDNGQGIAGLETSGALTLLDRSTETLTRITNDATAVQFFPGTPALLFLTSENHLGTYYYRDATDDELHTRGEFRVSASPLPLAASGTIGWALSFPGTLLVHASGTLLASETDLRSNLNTTVLATQLNAYAIEHKTLYLLDRNGTLRSATLVK